MANDKLQKMEAPGALAVPDYVKTGDARGHEGIEQGDLILPRLAVAQPTSPELTKGDPKHIQGLTAGDLFNTVTRESYGEGPVRVIIVRREKRRAMEFNPISEGGGIKDRDVALTDPRCAFGPDGEPPVATEFREYVAFLADTYEPIALSFKGTSLNSAKMLNTLLEMPVKGQQVAYFAKVFGITAALKKNDKGSFYVFGVSQLGYADETAYNLGAQTYENMKGRALALDESADDASDSTEKAPF